MTKATGALERRRRAEALFGAELMIRRAALHLRAQLPPDFPMNRVMAPEPAAVGEAFDLLRASLLDIWEQQRSVR